MLKLVLLQGYTFGAGDYGRQHAFKIYDESDAPFDATAYGLPVVRVFDTAGSVVTVTGSWTTQGQGAGTFSFTQASHPAVPGPYYIAVQLEKPGSIVTTERRRLAVVLAG